MRIIDLDLYYIFILLYYCSHFDFTINSKQGRSIISVS
jgi:hypothetical protein